MSSGETEDLSLLELFRAEVESHATVLNEGLIGLEAKAAGPAAIEPLMRAAHSIKGAARVVGLDAAVRIAHGLEDALVAAGEGKLVLTAPRVDLMLACVDWLVTLSGQGEDALPGWLAKEADAATDLEQRLATIHMLEGGETAPGPATTTREPEVAPQETHEPAETDAQRSEAARPGSEGRAVRVTAESLSRLIGLAAESLVGSRRLEPLGGSLLKLKEQLADVSDLLEAARESVSSQAPRERTARLTGEAQRALGDCRRSLAGRIGELDAHSRRAANLSSRLYHEVLSSRMRPFDDATPGLVRLVRDVARRLGKQARLEIEGRSTAVDREILAKLEAPLQHLLRNAIDHGLEMPDERESAGKPAEGCIQIDARHAGGMLLVRVTDDGRGIDPERVRRKVVERGLISAETAAKLGQSELFEFLLLPGMSTREDVSEISGRGVGLDVVQSMVQETGGGLRFGATPGRGTEIELRLPVTRSVLRSLAVEIAGEPYAFPLSRIERALEVDAQELKTVEGRPYLVVDDESIALVAAREVLEIGPPAELGETIACVVIGESQRRFALEVDGFAGECDLFVRPLDARLGKVPDVACASTLEDGRPVLILDVDDLSSSIDALVTGGRWTRARRAAAGTDASHARRILVVEDSLTVRELERRLLESLGYQVEVAVDGMEGWNAVRLGDYDLILTDVDMPRMNGIELTRRIKADPRFRALPVVIVSYKDREEDRLRGLEAGADHYLTKSSFQDETLARVVRDLLGEQR